MHATLEARFEEVQRGVFSVPVSVPAARWRPILPPHAEVDCEECTFRVAPEDVAAVAANLRRAGFAVRTLWDETNELAAQRPAPTPTTPFREVRIPAAFAGLANTDFLAFSFTTRRLRRLRVRESRDGPALFVRLEQPVIVRTNAQNRATIVATEAGFERAASVQELLERAHRGSRPARVYYEPAGPFALLYDPGIYLPPAHYTLLYKKLGASPSSSGTGRAYDGAAVVSAADLPLIEHVLRTLNIEFVPGSPPEQRYRRGLEAAERASRFLQGSYWDLFSNESQRREVASVLARCEWEKVDDETVRGSLIDLSNRAFDGDLESLDLLTYFQRRLPVQIDYRLMQTLGEDGILRGLTIEQSAPLGDEIRRTYLCVLPDLHLMLQATSTVNLGRGRRAPTLWLADQWYAFPYFGRFKFTSHTAVEWDYASPQETVDLFISRFFGIPSIEQQLAGGVYLAGFFHDRNPGHWIGTLEFTRYFASFGKLLVRETGEMDVPTALMEDVTGKPFFLRYGVENYLAQQEAIALGKEGRWKRFIAANFMIRKLRDPGEIPVFDLLPGSRPKDVGWDAILDGSVLALARYHGRVGRDEIQTAITHPDLARRCVNTAIRRGVESGRLLPRTNCVAYRIGRANDPPLCLMDFLDPGAYKAQEHVPSQILVYLLYGPILHPLWLAQPLAGEREPTDEERLLAEARRRIKRPYDYFRPFTRHVIAFLKEALSKHGVVHLKGPTSRTPKVIPEVLPQLEGLAEKHGPHGLLRVLRKDTQEDGKEVTEHLIWSERLLWRSYAAAKFERRGWRVRKGV